LLIVVDGGSGIDIVRISTVHGVTAVDIDLVVAADSVATVNSVTAGDCVATVDGISAVDVVVDGLVDRVAAVDVDGVARVGVARVNNIRVAAVVDVGVERLVDVRVVVVGHSAVNVDIVVLNIINNGVEVIVNSVVVVVDNRRRGALATSLSLGTIVIAARAASMVITASMSAVRE